MTNNIIYIGLDVDDTNFHGCAVEPSTGELFSFKCRPTLKGLLKQVSKLEEAFPRHTVKLCYEASYIGYTLKRDLAKHDIDCDVVAPTSIPSPRGKQIKTDRIDAAQLAQFYANGLLTIVSVPDQEQETDRDLLRSRKKLQELQGELRRHIHALMRRSGRNFRLETTHITHWRTPHYLWLENIIDKSTGSFKANLSLLVKQLKDIDLTLTQYDREIDTLAQSSPYQTTVKALICYKGIKNLFALTIATEIGDIKRFEHPRKLASWIGMDIREYSSGGKHNRFGITKQGNKFLRHALVEANQKGYRSFRVTNELKARRRDTDPELIRIADRCQQRLYKKGNHLLNAGKHPNKVKVACAREMVGFVWESLQKVA